MSHIDGEAYWRYPAAGDPTPARADAKILLLSRDNICTQGHWDNSGFWKAWSPLPKRDKDKEARIHGDPPKA